MSAALGRWREVLLAATPVAVVGTLVCCALPITLVALGGGAVVASLVATAPGFVVLSRNKEWVFALVGLLLLANYWVLYKSGSIACQPGGVCHISHPFGRWMRRGLWTSVAVYIVGVAGAYLSLPIAKMLGY